MTRFFNNDDVVNITCDEITELINKDSTVDNRLKHFLRSTKPNKWLEASKLISGSDRFSRSIESVYNYIEIMCNIANQGVITSVSRERRTVKDVKSLEDFWQSLGYKHDNTGENWNGPDSADLYDAKESYNLAKRALTSL